MTIFYMSTITYLFSTFLDFTNWAFYRPNKGKYLPEHIDPRLCTHIIYGFATLNPKSLKIRAHDSWADIGNEMYKKVTELKGRNRKVSLAIGKSVDEI